MMCSNELENILRNLVNSKNWKGVIKFGSTLSIEEKAQYLWVWPTETNLKFIKNVLDSYKINAILSIGCGTGLLEWIIHESTGINVNGIEYDKKWWDSTYSIKPFINLRYLLNHITSDFLKNSMDRDDWKFALLFCYFNNRKAFDEYIKNYKGNCVIIIGPGEGRCTHTDPEPFDPKFNVNDIWILKEFCEIDSTKDFITVYIKEI